jgi:hypothetical protein
MQQWEYLSVVLDRAGGVKHPRYLNNTEQEAWRDGPDALTYFNTLGKEGWELIAFAGENEEYLFKRPLTGEMHATLSSNGQAQRRIS